MENLPMRNRVIGLAGIILWLSGSSIAHAQEMPLPRYEVGMQFTSPYLREFSHVLPRRSEFGVGGRFTMNLTNLIAAEAQTDVYPKDRFFDYRRKVQGLFGVRAGTRRGRVGLFGKLRPGFIHVRDRLVCAIPEGCGRHPNGWIDDYTGRFWFALDAGAVVEIYPSQRLVLRIDAGDLLVRRFDGSDGSGKHYYSSHNLNTGAGVALRF
jgi:hypothetical protein